VCVLGSKKRQIASKKRGKFKGTGKDKKKGKRKGKKGETTGKGKQTELNLLASSRGNKRNIGEYIIFEAKEDEYGDNTWEHVIYNSDEVSQWVRDPVKHRSKIWEEELDYHVGSHILHIEKLPGCFQGMKDAFIELEDWFTQKPHTTWTDHESMLMIKRIMDDNPSELLSRWDPRDLDNWMHS